MQPASADGVQAVYWHGVFCEGRITLVTQAAAIEMLHLINIILFYEQ